MVVALPPHTHLVILSAAELHEVKFLLKSKDPYVLIRSKAASGSSPRVRESCTTVEAALQGRVGDLNQGRL